MTAGQKTSPTLGRACSSVLKVTHKTSNTDTPRHLATKPYDKSITSSRIPCMPERLTARHDRCVRDHHPIGLANVEDTPKDSTESLRCAASAHMHCPHRPHPDALWLTAVLCYSLLQRPQGELSTSRGARARGMCGGGAGARHLQRAAALQLRGQARGSISRRPSIRCAMVCHQVCISRNG